MGFILDLRYALRLLAKSPKFTIMTSFILMGGLTVSLMAFNFVFTMAKKPLDTPEGHSIVGVAVSGQYPTDLLLGTDVAALDKQVLEQYYAQYSYSLRQSGRLTNEKIGMNTVVHRVSSNFFDFTRFTPLLGRSFTEAEEQAGQNRVMAISYRVWQSLFNGDSNVIGRTTRLDTQSYEIVAVMPKGYRFPIQADLWVPLTNDFWQSPQAKTASIKILARFKPDADQAGANDFLASHLNERTLERLSESEKADYEQIEVEHLSIPEQHLKDSVTDIFLALQGIALAILLMACINTGNLIFARSIERQKESAIRAALGAKQGRLVRQLVLEGGLLTLVGGFLAILLAGWLIDLVNHAMRSNNDGKMPFWFVWQMDWQTMSVAWVFMLITFIFACLLPAMRATKIDINMVLRDGTRGALGRAAGKVSRLLVVVQVALIASLMLTGSLGIVLMNKVADAVIDKQLSNRFLGDFEFTSREIAQQHSQNLLQTLKAQPNILDTGIQENTGPASIRLQGQPLDAKVDILITTGNISMFGQEVLSGRAIDFRDNEDSGKVAIVSDSFVKQYWPATDPLGQMLEIEVDGQFMPHRVIGVADNRGYNSQGVFAQPEHYHEIHISYLQSTSTRAQISIQTSDNVEQGKQEFYNVSYQLDVKPYLTDFRDRQATGEAFSNFVGLITKVIIYSGLFSLFLALMGVFGVAASNVAMRKHEVGIRRAIGAKDRAIIVLFLKRNMVPLSIGLFIGLTIYAVVCYLFSTMVGNRIEVTTYITIALVSSLVLSFILCMAAYFPTRTAIEKEPFEILRAE